MTDEDCSNNRTKDILLALADVATRFEAHLTEKHLAALEVSLWLVNETCKDPEERLHVSETFGLLEWHWDNWRTIVRATARQEDDHSGRPSTFARSVAENAAETHEPGEVAIAEERDPSGFDLPCSYCGAAEGEACRTSSGRVTSLHAARPITNGHLAMNS